MATMTETPQAVSPYTPTHEYHAEAHILSGHLKRPIEQKIERYAPVELHDRRGGHLVRFDKDVSIEGLISFTKGETRVSGSRSLKNNGWVTLSTSIVEGLNVFEVITADRVVSQISTKHAYENGHVPDVTFLGTQFTNLQVSGFPVTLKLNLGICGAKPEGGRSYLDDPTFLKAVREQTKKIAHANGLPNELKHHYDEELDSIDQLISSSGKESQGSRLPKVICSLIESIGEIPIPGVKSFGHVLVIPEFGSVALGEIEVGEKTYKDSIRPGVYFELTLVKMNLGCVGHGTVQAASTTANGRHNP
jgi:hypothetical protein